MAERVILETNFSGLKLVKQGKVRDVYEVGGNYLIVCTDRISAFDVILNDGIPFKGKVLNQISAFWFKFTEDIIENHMISIDVDEFPDECAPYKDELRGRSMLVKKTEPLAIESVVRGYISGSGWKDYLATGAVCGIQLPENLRESEKLAAPIFTPATKAEIGEHDENISEQIAGEIIGEDNMQYVKRTTIDIYNKCYEYAFERGIILADTKMEFGIYDGRIILIDELLSPDSSRFWPLTDYQPGRSQNSFDKQYVRDYLLSIKFDKKPPAPKIPEDVIENTSQKYAEAVKLLTGEDVI